MKVHLKKKEKLNKKETVVEPTVCPEERKIDREALHALEKYEEYMEKIALGEALYRLIGQWGGEEATLPTDMKEALDVYMKQGDIEYEFGEYKPCSENAPLDLDEQDKMKKVI